MNAGAKNAIIDGVRWFCVLPGAVAAQAVFNLVHSYAFTGFCCINFASSRWGKVIDGSVLGYFDGMIFVIAGVAIAPRGRRVVSVVLATVICTLLAVISALGVTVVGWRPELIPLAFLAVGCVSACVLIYDDRESLYL